MIGLFLLSYLHDESKLYYFNLNEILEEIKNKKNLPGIFTYLKSYFYGYNIILTENLKLELSKQYNKKVKKEKKKAWKYNMFIWYTFITKLRAKITTVMYIFILYKFRLYEIMNWICTSIFFLI